MEPKPTLNNNGRKLILIESIYISLGTFYFGYNMAVFNQLQKCFEVVNEYPISTQKFFYGLLTSLLPLGAIIGSLLAPILCEKAGKRQIFIICDVMGIIANIAMITTNPFLFIGRFISGIIVGINTVTVTSFINEISPHNLSSTTGAVISIMINLGIFVAFLLGLHMPNGGFALLHCDELYWRKFMIVFPSLTCFIRFLVMTCFIKYDTPDFYLSLNQEEDAKNVLSKYYDESCVPQALNEIKTKKQLKTLTGFSELFNYRFKNRMILGVFLNVFQQFIGINAVIFYSTQIFSQNNENDDNLAKIFTAIIGIILIFTSYLSGKFLDKFGRKTILLYGHFVCTFMLFFLMLCSFLHYQEPTKYLVLLYIFSFGMSLGPAVYVYLPEILPEKGVGISLMFNWICCFLIGLIFPVMLDAFNIGGCFLSFFLISLVGHIYMRINVKETKNKTKKEIEEIFNTQKKFDEGPDTLE